MFVWHRYVAVRGGVVLPAFGELVVGDGSEQVSVPRVQRDEVRVRYVIAAVGL